MGKGGAPSGAHSECKVVALGRLKTTKKWISNKQLWNWLLRSGEVIAIRDWRPTSIVRVLIGDAKDKSLRFVERSRYLRELFRLAWFTRATFLGVKSNIGLFWFCFTSLYDWTRKLALLSQPIRFKTKTNRHLVTRVFRARAGLFVFTLSSNWLL